VPKADTSAGLDGQRASVGEEGWRTARVEENDIVVWLPPSCPYEGDETSKPFARVDRVKHEGFEGTRQKRATKELESGQECEVSFGERPASASRRGVSHPDQRVRQ